MKKLICLLLALILCAGIVSVSANGDNYILVTSATENSGVGIKNGGATLNRGGYLGFENVDLTGVKSISLKGISSLTGGANGDAFGIRIDDPVKGDCLGYVVFNEEGEDVTFSTDIKEVSGVHKLYITSTYGGNSLITLKEIVLSENPAEKKVYVPVSDSVIVDNFSDTWAGTDHMGRKLADFEEVGPVKEGLHEVGMLYWDWTVTDLRNARIPSEIIAAHPSEKDNFYSDVWDENGNYFWAEPLFGFYTSNEYWVYRRHAEMLTNAGVDAIFFDFSNGSSAFIVQTNTLFSAFYDAKKAGVNVPGVSCLSSWNGDYENRLAQIKCLYLNYFRPEKYNDLWYKWEGKPVMFGSTNPDTLARFIKGEDPENDALLKEIFDYFTFRANGSRQGGEYSDEKAWNWLMQYPQTAYGKTADGRIESMSAGTAINQSYVFMFEKTGVFSDPYTKGRSYTEGFGEDYRPEAMHMGYFFREQMSRVLATDPALVMIDGWNEWTAVRNAEYSGFKNSFVDTFDDENSRDFEPSAGVLGDGYYNILVDYVRKYKGVRPAPLASGEVTIDINGDIAQWSDVSPEFINIDGGYERNATGLTNGDTGEKYVFTSKLSNIIRYAKVARDGENFYFMAECEGDVVKNDSFMHLYIDADRNRATGWEGYDYAVNVTGDGEISTYNGSAWEKVADSLNGINGKYYTVAIPRSILSEDVADLEFKWADYSFENGDILRFYEFGSVAPMGRFNYLYTEIQQKSLSSETRKALSDTSVFKAGSNKMFVSGGKTYVYDADTRISTFTENGMLYVPAIAYEYIMGDGETKMEYRQSKNMFFLKNFNLKNFEITDNIWSYTVIGTNEVRINGEAATLSAPVIVRDGLCYVPLSYVCEVFGWHMYKEGGIYAVSSHEIDINAVRTAAAEF